jgi:hypothetical protein
MAFRTLCCVVHLRVNRCAPSRNVQLNTVAEGASSSYLYLYSQRSGQLGKIRKIERGKEKQWNLKRELRCTYRHAGR